jgi:hypothetical protein
MAHQPNAGEAARNASAAIILGIGSNVATLLGGLIVAIIYRKGGPAASDWTLIFAMMGATWAVIALQLLHTATQGIQSTVPEPNPFRQHYGNGKGHIAVPLEELPRWLPAMPKLGNCYVIDVAWFVQRIIPTLDWQRRTWEGLPLPSGLTCDRDYHRELMKVVSHSGIVLGYRPRAKGRLLCRSVRMAWDHLKIPQLLPGFEELLVEFERKHTTRELYKLG